LRGRRHRSIPDRPAPFLTPAQVRAVQARSAPRPAIEAPPQIHLHGPVSAADVAELIAPQGNPRPANEEY
jgi:hypothetical protein